MVSLSLHYLERENNITKKGNFLEKYEIFRETFHFFHFTSTHLKTKWQQVQQKSQCRHVVPRHIHRCHHQIPKVFPLEIMKV